MSREATCRGVRRPELLAPAGNEEMMRAAVENGADAIYFGLPEFNARLRADNFRLADLPRLMSWLHERGVRGYVTLNTLIFCSEMETVAQLLADCCRAGVDAVLIQDLGFAALAGRMVPAMKLHASTQTTLTAPESFAATDRLGLRLSRVVAARELTLEDLRRFKQQTDKEIEAFIHGALCVAYSGQCLTSEALGGRSANRGECAQACRLPYGLVVDGRPYPTGDMNYPLSPKDLLGYEDTAELVAMGIDGLKIEGRLKSANYVAATVQAYREAIDRAARPDNQSTPTAAVTVLDAPTRRLLEQTFSRGFTRGYLHAVDHRDIVEGRFPKKRGSFLGRVVGVSRRGVEVCLEGPLRPGDGVVFDSGHPDEDEEGGRVYELWRGNVRLQEFKPADRYSSSEARPGTHRSAAGSPPVGVSRNSKSARSAPSAVITLTFGEGKLDLRRVHEGDLVWKTSDPRIEAQLAASYAGEQVRHRRPVCARVTGRPGEPICLMLEDWEGNTVEIADGEPAEEPRTQPLTPQVLEQQLSRLGGTPFRLERLDCEIEGAVMVPLKRLNEMRRRAVEALIELRRSMQSGREINRGVLQTMRARIPKGRLDREAATGISLAVLCRSLDQVEAAVGVDGVDAVYGDFEDLRHHREARQMVSSVRRYAPATLRITKPGETSLARKLLEVKPDAVLVRNLAAWLVLRDASPETPLIGDYALNVANDLSASLLHENGFARLTPSYDLNIEQLLDLLRHAPAEWFEVTIHQHLPMFHMEHCVFCRFLSGGSNHKDCGRPCEKHHLALRDRMGYEHPVQADAGCRNTVYNAVAQSASEYIGALCEAGVRHVRIEFLFETADEVRDVLGAYLPVVRGNASGHDIWKRLRASSRLGVTRGSLDHD